jgi:hypothetical protein
VELPLGVVVAASCGVRECEVGIVDELELASSLLSLWRVGGDSIRVSL